MGRRLISELWFFLFCSLLWKGSAEVGAALTVDPGWSTLFVGEFVTLTCDVEGEDSDWKYIFNKDNKQYFDNQKAHFYKFKIASTRDGGEYDCVGRHKSSLQTEISDTVSLTVAEKPKATLTSGNKIISVGGKVRLSCSVGNYDGWKFEFLGSTSTTSGNTVKTTVLNNEDIEVSKGGTYRCRGVRETSDYLSDFSDEVTIRIIFTNQPVITPQHNWSEMFDGETITLTCEVQGGGATDWWYEWRNSQSYREGHERSLQITASQSLTGGYTCRARRRDDFYSSTSWSKAFTLSVLPKPEAELSSSKYNMSEGSTVMLTCSVKQSHGWKYFWYRDEKYSPLNTHDTNEYSSQYEVSQEGRYWCRGGRGDPIYYTEYSDLIVFTGSLPHKVTLTLQPDWPQLYKGETVTLRCDIDGGNTGWEYEWETTSPVNPPNLKDYRIESVSSRHQGNYTCKGKMKSKQQSTTWSNTVNLRVLSKPELVLSVSPSWLIPGASVTLICHTEPPSAGWSFYWFKVVPESQSSYTYEPLPGTSSGTTNNYFTVHGQTHTAGYACSAGRGDPVFYTEKSRPNYVWSSDVHPSVSLTVNPARVQHFTSESLSLTCEGNSTQLKRITFKTNNLLFNDFTDATINGSIYIKNERPSKAVYWCESGTAFSNAVNISTLSDEVILVSPVYPVPAGESVTLHCELKTGNVTSDVFFYKNNKVVQNDIGGEMKISVVSESDEGFYKCRYKGTESAESWMAVKFASRSRSSLSPLMIIRWICGLSLLTVLSLLLCFYKGSKGNSAPAATAETVYGEITEVNEETSSPPPTE